MTEEVTITEYALADGSRRVEKETINNETGTKTVEVTEYPPPPPSPIVASAGIPAPSAPSNAVMPSTERGVYTQDIENQSSSYSLTIERKEKPNGSCVTFMVYKNDVPIGPLPNGGTIVVPGITIGDMVEVFHNGPLECCKTQCNTLGIKINKPGHKRIRIKHAGIHPKYTWIILVVFLVIFFIMFFVPILGAVLIMILAIAIYGYLIYKACQEDRCKCECDDCCEQCCDCDQCCVYAPAAILPCNTGNADIGNGSLLLRGYPIVRRYVVVAPDPTTTVSSGDPASGITAHEPVAFAPKVVPVPPVPHNEPHRASQGINHVPQPPQRITYAPQPPQRITYAPQPPRSSQPQSSRYAQPRREEKEIVEEMEF